MKAALMLPNADSACKQAKRIGRAARRHHFGDQRHADRELATDAQARQKSIEREVIDRHRKRTEPGTERVHQDRDEHRLGPADPVAEHAEDQAAGRPTGDEDARRDVAGVAASRRVSSSGVSAVRDAELRHRLRPSQNEQLLIEAVEQPAEGGHDEHEPVIAIQKLIPRPAIVRIVGNAAAVVSSKPCIGRGPFANYAWTAV